MAVENQRFRIMYRNVIDMATLVSEPALNNVATMPIANVKNFDRSENFRSTAIDANGIVISGELATAERVSGAAIYRHNLRAGDTWRFRGWTGPGKTGTEIDTGFVPALLFKTLGELDSHVDTFVTTVFDDPGWETAFSHLYFDSLAIRSFEIQIVSENNPDGFIDINRIWLARAFSFQRNFGYEYELDFVGLSKVSLSEAESIKVDEAGWFRRIKIVIPRIFDSDRANAADLIRQALNSNEVFINLFPEQGGKLERDYTMTAIIPDRSALRSLNINKHSLSFTFRET